MGCAVSADPRGDPSRSADPYRDLLPLAAGCQRLCDLQSGHSGAEFTPWHLHDRAYLRIWRLDRARGKSGFSQSVSGI